MTLLRVKLELGRKSNANYPENARLDKLLSGILTGDADSVRARCAEKSVVPWQQAMRKAIRTGAELRRRLELAAAPGDERAESDFPVFVPLEFLAKMQPGNPDDPLLRQVLATTAETKAVPGFSSDPLREQSFSAQPGLLQKYQGRVLLVSTGACAVHCRYCFRRHYPYQSVPKGAAAWRPTVNQIAADPSINEVLLSGGDPLTLSDLTIETLCREIAAIPHVRRIRFHTRLPVVIPQRVTTDLVNILQGTRPTVWMVIHCNHPAELDYHTLAAVGRLVDAGIPVLNQAVLLRGVNDSVEVLEQLSLQLVDHRVQPYYLHQLDRVAGAADFEVPLAHGLALMQQLRTRLPGYAMPQFVQEQPEASSKTPLESAAAPRQPADVRPEH